MTGRERPSAIVWVAVLSAALFVASPRGASEAAPQPARVIVLFRDPVSEDSLARFRQRGGVITHGPWKHALHGFAGTLPGEDLRAYLAADGAVLQVADDGDPLETYLYHAARQVRARGFVWSTYGLSGDPLTAVAVIDSGIDAGHPAFHPGHGEGDWGKKIIGWRDFSSSDHPAPVDTDGHGTHVAAIVAGVGFASRDEQGRLVSTDSFSTRINGEYAQWGQVWVQTPGEIEVEVSYQAGRGKIDAVALYSGNREGRYEGPPGSQVVTGWNEVARLTDLAPTPDLEQGPPVRNRLRYTVPPDRLGLYHVVTRRRGIPDSMLGGLRFEVVLHWPAALDDQGHAPDGWPPLAGIAPGSRIVALRAVYPSDWVSAIDWCIQNRDAYHLTVVNISQGQTRPNAAIRTACVNAARAGLVLCAAAGNGGPGMDKLSYPAGYPDVVAVGAVNGADRVTHYSSQGGEPTTGVIKPDVVAPGGSTLLQGGIWSADSNHGNLPRSWGPDPDRVPDDAAPPQGTSQACAAYAGCAQILIEALGGWGWWRSREGAPESKVARVKQILAMTATETFPVPREETLAGGAGQGPVDPTLDLGAKDPHEGYGRINLDAAVEAALFELPPGGREGATLYASDAARAGDQIDLALASQRHAFARRIRLAAGRRCRLRLAVPPTGDFDLFLYLPEPGPFGAPRIAARSHRSGIGVGEDITFVAPADGVHYAVVKARHGKGAFLLQSGEPQAARPPRTEDPTLAARGMASANEEEFSR
jgi:subtilisin family serine protease